MQGFYSKAFFKHHKKRCQGDTTSVACAVPVSLLLSKVQVNKDVSEFTKKILSKFRGDDIGEICRSDKVITNIGKRLWTKEMGKQHKKSQVRKSVMANMRRLASLYTVLFSKDTVEAMVHLCDPELRETAGIPYDNTYVFACVTVQNGTLE